MNKKLMSLIAIVLVVVVACKEAAPAEQSAAVEQSASPDYAAFDKKIAVIRSFFKAHCDEDLEAQRSLLSDTLEWSPPNYNGNEWLGKEDFLAALKGYHDDFENIKYAEGIVMPDSTANGYWSGSVFPEANASIDPDVIRVYGTWTATHSASGKEVGVKFFSLSSVNEDGKIVQASDYFDVNGLAAQIAAQE
ncbi:MAG TPA: hypothetical protein VKN36_14235 [Eudoraea sp.]|nr:hypothetical protein [Eudoraea sp.]